MVSGFFGTVDIFRIVDIIGIVDITDDAGYGVCTL